MKIKKLIFIQGTLRGHVEVLTIYQPYVIILTHLRHEI